MGVGGGLLLSCLVCAPWGALRLPQGLQGADEPPSSDVLFFHSASLSKNNTSDTPTFLAGATLLTLLARVSAQAVPGAAIAGAGAGVGWRGGRLARDQESPSLCWGDKGFPWCWIGQALSQNIVLLPTEVPPLSGGPRKTLAGARTRRAHTEERAGLRERENFGRIVR